MSTIIECPACATRYKMNKPIPEGGRSVKCARCSHQWRIAAEEPEELVEALDDEVDADASEEQQPAATAEAEGRHEDADPDEETIGDAWDVRRGHLAAAIASMRETPNSAADEAEAEAAEAEAAEHDFDDQDAFGHHGAFAQAAWHSDETAHRSYAADDDMADTEASGHDDAEAAANALDEALEASDAAFGEAPPSSWPASPAWMTGAATADPKAGEMDPESSVRLVIKAAIDDQDGNETAAFDAKGGISSVSRPVFTDTTSFEETMAEVAAEAAEDSPAGDSQAWPTDSGESNFSAFPRRDFTVGRGAFKAGEREAPAGDPDAAEPGETNEDTEKFENDIVGIFRRQMQEKRSFGPAAAQRHTEDDFTDYDNEFGGGSEQADDRYMADSPLDADAAALQAALEGSLRERRGEEAGNGGGGGLALAAAWAVFLSVLSGVTLAFISFRDEMVVALPGTAALYRGIGLAVQDRQVDFDGVTYRWTTAEGKPMIEVTGRIINLTDREIAVPRVLVNVLDKESADTVKATATVRSEPLGARETADFTLEFLSPPKTISQIELAFAETN